MITLIFLIDTNTCVNIFILGQYLKTFCQTCL